MQFVAVLVVLVAVTKGDGGTCDGSLVQALQKCANAIKGGESLSVQQEKCAPDGCNYDCPSASKYDDLNKQFKDLSEAFETLQMSIANNTASITANAGNIKDLKGDIDGSGHFACGSFGWTRVAYLDMSDPSQDCPTEFRLYEVEKVRACGRQISAVPSCNSKVFPSAITYSEVCGRVLGYQYGSADAIGTNNDGHDDLNSYYVDGISITRGSPRQHVWTYMVGYSEVYNNGNDCPCNNGIEITVQSFIGNDYHCESGLPEVNYEKILYSSDTLWDGDNCRDNEVPCCQYADLPWFYKVLDVATDDHIEIRICADQETDNEDATVFLYEIFVK